MKKIKKYSKQANFNKQITFLLLFFASVLFVNAQPQSFLISPRQTIENGTGDAMVTGTTFP